MRSMKSNAGWRACGFGVLVCCGALTACSAQADIKSRANPSGASKPGASDTKGSKDDQGSGQPSAPSTPSNDDRDVPSTDDVLVKDQSKITDAGGDDKAAAMMDANFTADGCEVGKFCAPTSPDPDNCGKLELKTDL